MGEVKDTKPVLYFSSIIYNSEEALKNAVEKLCELLGETEEITEEMPFDHTDYYNEEMGECLKRRFLLFKILRKRDDLPKIKLKTNEIEKDLSNQGKRTANIDPGYITLENVVLATTKGYSHRIYIGSGIFGDLTLIYRKGSYRSLDWTYPDYRSEKLISIFNKWRGLLKDKLRRSQKC